MLFTDKRIVLFVGGYGSGKTEIAVNYALAGKANDPAPTAVVDLDIVNPYFRSREQADLLASQGVELIAPQGAWRTADLPALPPEIQGSLTNPDCQVILDVGGDDAGATALGRYSRFINQAGYEMWFVINGCRPFSKEVEPTIMLMRKIEQVSRLKVTGLVNNTNLMQHTDVALLQRGAKLVEAIGEKTELPVVFHGVAADLVDAAHGNLAEPILPLQLLMKRPWE